MRVEVLFSVGDDAFVIAEIWMCEGGGQGCPSGESVEEAVIEFEDIVLEVMHVGPAQFGLAEKLGAVFQGGHGSGAVVVFVVAGDDNDVIPLVWVPMT